MLWGLVFHLRWCWIDLSHVEVNFRFLKKKSSTFSFGRQRANSLTFCAKLSSDRRIWPNRHWNRIEWNSTPESLSFVCPKYSNFQSELTSNRNIWIRFFSSRQRLFYQPGTLTCDPQTKILLCNINCEHRYVVVKFEALWGTFPWLMW